MLLFSILLDEEEKSQLLALYHRYKRYMYVIAYDILKSREEAEDVLSDSIEKISRNLNRIKEPESNQTKGYIATIVKHTAIDRYRRADQKNLSLKEDERSLQVSVEQEVENKMTLESVLQAIKSLDERYRTVLELRYLDQLSDAEIAAQLDITKENVRKRVQRARQMLLETMEKSEE